MRSLPNPFRVSMRRRRRRRRLQHIGLLSWRVIGDRDCGGGGRKRPLRRIRRFFHFSSFFSDVHIGQRGYCHCLRQTSICLSAQLIYHAQGDPRSAGEGANCKCKLSSREGRHNFDEVSRAQSSPVGASRHKGAFRYDVRIGEGEGRNGKVDKVGEVA